MPKTTKIPTISDIKWMTSETSPYFFSRDSMKFFGQTMRDFKVRKSPKGRIFVFAKTKHGISFRQYIPSRIVGKAKLELVRNAPDTMAQAAAYVKAH